MNDETPFTHDDDCFELDVRFIEVNGDSPYDPTTDHDSQDTRDRVVLPPADEDKPSDLEDLPHDMWWYNPCTK